MRILFRVAFVAGLVVAAAGVRADTISIVGNGSNSTENLGRFEGSLSYAYDAGIGAGDLTVLLKNTTSSAIGGYLTAFLFNVHGSAVAFLHPNPTGTFWTTSPTGESGSPFGVFEAGAALDGDKDPWGDFLGGGSPTTGIKVGASQTFHFRVIGSAASSLTASSFIQDAGVGGSHSATFLVRFKGMANGGSDKVGGSTPPNVVVPLPAAAWGGIVLLGVLGAARRIRRRSDGGDLLSN